MEHFYSHGKLLITGEYAVLKGAKALAIPCKKGQKLSVTPIEDSKVEWNSFDVHQNRWFTAHFKTTEFSILESTDRVVANRLSTLLKIAREENESFLEKGCTVNTELEFDRRWGLGSSSTLVSNVARWAKVNPYTLLEKTFGGSGYDLACAQADRPLFYTRQEYSPLIESVSFSPPFKEHLFFVFLNQKQNSQEAVRSFAPVELSISVMNLINELSEKIAHCTSQETFNLLLKEHESTVGQIIGQIPIQQRIFSDFDGVVKSLGAWGGDFILASGNKNTPAYFKKRGFSTIVPFSEMCYSDV